MTIKPIGNRLIVRPIKAPDSVKVPGSDVHIFTPAGANKTSPSQEGIVLTLGTGGYFKNGERIPFEVQPGDKVLFSTYGGIEQKMNDGQEVKIISALDVFAVLEGQ